jgi:hypothetical protein
MHARPAGTRPALRARLADDHVLAVLMDEHQRLLARLARLREIADLDLATLQHAQRIERLEEVLGIASELLGAEPHHQREERVLFPALQARGIHGPPTVMCAEHEHLRSQKHALESGARRVLETGGHGWIDLMRAAHGLAHDLEGHIHKEDEILYPMAFQVLDPGEWAGLKERCDRIGYCCHAHA